LMFLVNWFWSGVLATTGAGAADVREYRAWGGHATVPRRVGAVQRRGCGARPPGSSRPT